MEEGISDVDGSEEECPSNPRPLFAGKSAGLNGVGSFFTDSQKESIETISSGSGEIFRFEGTWVGKEDKRCWVSSSGGILKLRDSSSAGLLASPAIHWE